MAWAIEFWMATGIQFLQCEYLTGHVGIAETLRHGHIFRGLGRDQLHQTPYDLGTCKVVDQVLLLRLALLQYVLLVQKFLQCGVLRMATTRNWDISTWSARIESTYLLLEQRLYIRGGRITLVPKHFSHVRLGGDTFSLGETRSIFAGLAERWWLGMHGSAGRDWRFG